MTHMLAKYVLSIFAKCYDYHYFNVLLNVRIIF